MKKIISKHMSFLIMLFGSGAFFLSNILCKQYLSDNEFYYWNVLLTLINISLSFCFLGSEQLLVRLGKEQGAKYSIRVEVIYIMLFSMVIFQLSLVGLCFLGFFDFYIIMYGMIISLCISGLIFLHNLYRVNFMFNFSQIIINSWKFFIFITLIISFYYSINIEYVITVSFCFATLCALLFYRSSDFSLILEAFKGLDNELINLYISFVFSLFVITLMGSVDRLAIEQTLSKDEFSLYVYLMTIVIMPFGLLSSYFGFKEVAYLKVNFSKDRFIYKLIKVFWIVTILFSIWFIFIYMVKDIIYLDIDMSYFIPCYLLAVIRCMHSIISSLLGVRAKSSDIKNANLIVLVLIVFIALAFYLGVVKISILASVYMMAFVWVVRTLVFYLYIRRLNDA